MNAYKYVKTHAAQLGLEGFDFTTEDVAAVVGSVMNTSGSIARNPSTNAFFRPFMLRPIIGDFAAIT